MDPSGCYDDLVTLRSFLPQYRLIGGINLPKIIDCLGSDGKTRRQLVKVGGGRRRSSSLRRHSYLSPGSGAAWSCLFKATAAAVTWD